MDIVYSLWAFLTEPWALLALIASLAFACENYIDEWLLIRLGDKTNNEKDSEAVGTLVIISGLFGLVVACVFGLVAYVLPQTTIIIGADIGAQATFVGALEIAWIIPYMYAMNRVGTLKAAPLFQSVPVVALFLGLFAFAEIPPMIHIVGAGAIVGGGFLLSLSEIEGKWNIDKLTVGLMLLASTIIAGVSFLFKDAALEGNFVATVFWGGIGMSLASVLLLIVCRPYRRQFVRFCHSVDKRGILVQVLNETVDMVAVLTQHAAMILGPTIMTVSALNAYQPVFILLIGWLLAKNGSKLHANQLQGNEFLKKSTAIAFIAFGTVLIAQ